METMTVYELIQHLTEFESNDKVAIKNNNIYIINPNIDVTDDDIDKYEIYTGCIHIDDDIENNEEE